MLALNSFGQTAKQIQIDNIRTEIEANNFKNNQNKVDQLISIDPNYYVSQYVKAMSLFVKAADFEGFQNCTPYFLKALSLLETQHKHQLRVTDYNSLFIAWQKLMDYNSICDALTECYTVCNSIDSIFYICNRYENQKFIKNFGNYQGGYLTKAWTIHRNRFLTSKQNSIFKNSIEENEKYCLRIIDSAEIQTKRLSQQYSSFVPEDLYAFDYSNVAHLRSIIFAYQKKYKESEAQFRKLEGYNTMSYNNYALLCLIQGKFSESSQHFKTQSIYAGQDKSLQEWLLYNSILNTYSGNNYKSIVELKNWIAKNGSSPGFGWYNIALARAYINNGELNEASWHLSKSDNFSESNIGTTLGIETYNITKAILKIQVLESKIDAVKFENKHWYVSISDILKILKLKWQLILTEWNTMTLLSSYGDREKVIYELFSSESTLTWYESWSLIEKLSSSYFKNFYTKLVENKQAPERIQFHYKYILAKQNLDDGNDEMCKKYINDILNSTIEKTEYLNYLIAKTKLLQIKLNQKNKVNLLNDIYSIYPQSIPFSDESSTFQLSIFGEENIKDPQVLISSLKKCNINFKKEKGNYPSASITFSKDIENEYVALTVLDNHGKTVVNQAMFSLSKLKIDGKKLAYLLFNIGNKKMETEEI